MRLGARTILAVGFCWLTLAFPSAVAAGEVGANPFLFRAFCSSCGPQTPLTLEQADAVEFMFTDSLDDLLTSPGIFPIEHDIPIDLVGPGSGRGGESPAHGGGVPGFVNPPSNNSGGNGPGGGGVPGGGGNAGGLDYGIGVTTNNPTTNNPSGSNGPQGGPNGPQTDGPNGPQNEPENDVTFTYGDDSTPLDLLVDVPGGGGTAGETLVPEPATLLLFGSGLSAVAMRLRRRTARVRS